MTSKHPLCQVLHEQPEDDFETHDVSEVDEPQANETFDEHTAVDSETWQFEPAICG